MAFTFVMRSHDDKETHISHWYLTKDSATSAFRKAIGEHLLSSDNPEPMRFYLFEGGAIDAIEEYVFNGYRKPTEPITPYEEVTTIKCPECGEVDELDQFVREVQQTNVDILTIGKHGPEWVHSHTTDLDFDGAKFYHGEPGNTCELNEQAVYDAIEEARRG